jgi:hypothetical protein
VTGNARYGKLWESTALKWLAQAMNVYDRYGSQWLEIVFDLRRHQRITVTLGVVIQSVEKM